MGESKEELLAEIESARKILNESIAAGNQYEMVYQYSVELDRLIELYIASGF